MLVTSSILPRGKDSAVHYDSIMRMGGGDVPIGIREVIVQIEIERAAIHAIVGVAASAPQSPVLQHFNEIRDLLQISR